MIRWKILAASAAVIAGAVFITGASAPHRPPVEAPAPRAKPVDVGQKVGYFDMAKVVRGFKRADNQVKALNEQQAHLSVEVVEWRAKFLKLQAGIPIEPDPNQRQRMAREMITLSQKIQEKDQEIGKIINKRASVIISDIHDEIYAVVAEIAHEHGLAAVVTYPDADTKEVAESPLSKQAKLQPPAVYPFYLDPSVDYTQELIDRVNAKFAADNEGK